MLLLTSCDERRWTGEQMVWTKVWAPFLLRNPIFLGPKGMTRFSRSHSRPVSQASYCTSSWYSFSFTPLNLRQSSSVYLKMMGEHELSNTSFASLPPKKNATGLSQPDLSPSQLPSARRRPACSHANSFPPGMSHREYHHGGVWYGGWDFHGGVWYGGWDFSDWIISPNPEDFDILLWNNSILSMYCMIYETQRPVGNEGW